MDSVGSNDMQQSDMNHAPPPPDTHPHTHGVQQHTLKGPVTQFRDKAKQDTAT